MNILQINNYHYVRGGAERVYLETSCLLRKHGHEVTHFSVRDREVDPDGVNEYFVDPVDPSSGNAFRRMRAACLFLYSRGAKSRLERLIRNVRPDIAHLHIFYGRLTSSILPVLKEHKIPVVMSVHEYRMLCPVYLMMDGEYHICERCASGNYCNCIWKKCNRGIWSYSLLSALECWYRDLFFNYGQYVDRFIMVSKFILDKHLSYKPALAGKARLLHNFVAPEQAVNRNAAGKHYLYAGRLSREKGLLTLLRAWCKFPDQELRIAGEGQMRLELERFVASRKMQNVAFLGKLDRTSMDAAFCAARYVIAPSEWYENNPMAVLEAFSRSTPVIAANIGGLPELVQHGINGILFESGSAGSLADAIALSRSLSDADYQAMSRRANDAVRNLYNPEQYYRRLMDIYEEVIT